MVCFKGFLHGKWGCAAAAALALLTLACGGSKDSSTATASGKVTYTRRPLATVNGVPTGLSGSYNAAQAARGVLVRAIAVKTEKLNDGSSSTAYLSLGYTYTDEYGNYSLSVPKDTPCFIEVQSIAGTGSTKAIRILSDADTDLADISSGTDSADCTLYSLRKALDGSSSTSNPVLATQSSGKVTVNFAVDSSTKWWIAPASVPTTTNALLASQESTATGSRILGIIDSIYTFADVYGDPTPGATLDLFYRPTMEDDSRGSFVDYSDASRYYGSLRANANDDAWDEAIIFMLCARNALYSHTKVSPYTPPSDQLPLDTAGLGRKTGLNQVHALIDGMAYGMAASLLKSPYLADTTGDGSTCTYLNLSALKTSGLGMDAFSAPGIAALSWDLLIKANTTPYGGKLTSDTYSEWSKIDSEGLRRFFTLAIPGDSSARPTDTASVYKQLLRLQEDPSSGDTIDLNNIFTDSVLASMVTPYGLTWPRPAVPASYLLDWGTDPDTSSKTIDAFQMDMASAHADASGTFPNLSKGEIVRAKFLLTKDVLYTFEVTLSSSLPAGTTIEISLVDASGQYQTFEISGSGGVVTDSLMLDGDSTTPKFIPVNFRLKTGSRTTIVDPVTVSVSLVPRAS